MEKLRSWTGHSKTIQILSTEGQMEEDVFPQPRGEAQTAKAGPHWAWRQKRRRAGSQQLHWRWRGWKENAWLLPSSCLQSLTYQRSQKPGSRLGLWAWAAQPQGIRPLPTAGQVGSGGKRSLGADRPGQTQEDSPSWFLKVQSTFRLQSQMIKTSSPFSPTLHGAVLNWNPDC